MAGAVGSRVTINVGTFTESFFGGNERRALALGTIKTKILSKAEN
jgi:hypothetical protein